MTEGATGTFIYDRVAYPSPILPMITPPRLAAAAVLNGFQSPPSATCSMLEIGCGDGSNLIGMAAFAPEARFVGFDLSREAIERGRALVNAVGLANIQLHVGDVTEYPREGERFDYIVTHGLYAWVPEPAREAILELTAARLAPGGIAYVSYDCLPAAGPKAVVNAFVNRQCGGIVDDDARIMASIRLIATLARHQTSGSRLDQQLKMYGEALPAYESAYILHDALADHYRPSTVLEVDAAAARYGLAIIGDGNLSDLFTADLDEEALQLLKAAGDDVAARAYALDMLRGANMFRRTLLCRRDAPARRAEPDSLLGLWFSLSATREEVEFENRPAVRYSHGPDIFMIAAEPPRLPVMQMLWESMPGEWTIEGLASATGVSLAEVIKVVTQGCALGIIWAYDSPPRHTLEPGERPRAWTFLRTMLNDQDWGLTLRHARIMVPQPMIRALIRAADGTRTHGDLSRELSAAFDVDIGPEKIAEAIEDLRMRRALEG